MLAKQSQDVVVATSYPRVARHGGFQIRKTSIRN